MTITDIPADSILHHWVRYLRITEVPFTYQVAGGLSILGALAKRNRWVDQVEWRVFPNQSIMYIGPSGVGKDTIINRVQRCFTMMEAQANIPTIAGKTLEYVEQRLLELKPPAAAFVPAAEMTAYFGKADYQENMLTGITNLLSNNERVDISTKGAYNASKGIAGTLPGQAKYIEQPTITMHAGSTVEWLHKSMPAGTLEGGFLGRFLIVVEEFSGRYIPLIKSDKSKAELDELRWNLDQWNRGMERLIQATTRAHPVIMYDEAEYKYANWYYNRFKQFSKAVMPYANRSRDTVLRLAMLMAFSRGHYRWVEECDVDFALSLMREVSQKIDAVVLPPTEEAQVANKILEMLPIREGEAYAALVMRYKRWAIEEAWRLLRDTKKVYVDPDGLMRLNTKER